MSCIYELNGHIFKSELALDDFILSKGKYLSKYGDLVFSLSDAQLFSKNQIAVINLDFRRSRLQQLIEKVWTEDGVQYKMKAPFIGVNRFISGLTDPNGRLFTPDFLEDNYWYEKVGKWNNGDFKDTEEQKEIFGDETPLPLNNNVSMHTILELLKVWDKRDRETKIATIVAAATPNNQIVLNQIIKTKKKWEAQGKIGSAIHKVMELCMKLNNENKTILELELNDSNILSQIKNLITDYELNDDTILGAISHARLLLENLHKRFGDDLVLLPELNVIGKLSHTYDNSEKNLHNIDSVHGIIDLLVIDKFGHAHIIDYKTSPKETYKSFDSAKKRAFFYLLGMYQRMLELYGLIFKNDRYVESIVPMLMINLHEENGKYVIDGVLGTEEGTEKIDGKDYKIILLDITNDIMENPILKNLNLWIPQVAQFNATSEEMLDSVVSGLRAMFGEEYRDTRTDHTLEEVSEMVKRHGGINFNKNTGKYEFNYRNSKLRYEGDSEMEVANKILEDWNDLPSARSRMLTRIKNVIKDCYEGNASAEKLNSIFEKRRAAIDKGANLDWFKTYMEPYLDSNRYEMLDVPVADYFGVIFFKNRYTNLIDIVKISQLNIGERFDFKNRNKRLTGLHLADVTENSKSDSLVLDATYGNIELMETMLILSKLPELTNGDAKIGNILVANPNYQKGISASNKELLYNFKLLSTLANKDHEIISSTVEDNLFADMATLAKNKLAEIMEMKKLEGLLGIFKSYKSCLSGLTTAIDDLDKRSILTQLNNLRIMLEKDLALKAKIRGKLSEELSNEVSNPMYSIYKLVMLAIALVSGIDYRLQLRESGNWIESDANLFKDGYESLYMDNPGNLRNETLNTMTKVLTLAYQNSREDMTRYIPKIRELTEKLKNAKNSTWLKEHTIANLDNLYTNMVRFEKKITQDPNGNPIEIVTDILFKDINDSSLIPEEKEYLEFILPIINRNRLNKTDDELEIMKNNGDKSYYRVPLKLGDNHSGASIKGMGTAFKEMLNKWNPLNLFKNFSLKLEKAFEETLQKLEGIHEETPESAKLWEMLNRFDTGEQSDEVRENEIMRMGGYEKQEWNLETLFLEHTYAFAMKDNIDKVMPLIKAAQIHIIAQSNLTNQKYTNDTNYINDYIKNKILNLSLVTSTQGKVSAQAFGYIKQAASLGALAFSPIQYGKQIMEGLWKDISLMIRKPDGTNAFSFKNFKSAFTDVYGDMFAYGDKPTKCLLLNEFYGLNDMDTNTYIDKIRSDQYGIFNFTNTAFRCSSRPDYYNRMMIFTTIMKEEGVWEAHSIEDGRLKYDFSKDSRFNLLATNNKSDLPAYNRLYALWKAIAEQLQREHAKNPDGSEFILDLEHPTLPKAFSNQQVESYKTISDNIYGYYAHEKKAMIHALTAGSLWMQMRTFWSGKKNQFAQGVGVKTMGNYVQRYDMVDGKKLNYYWLDDNGKLIPVREDKLTPEQIEKAIPVIEWLGLWQEGIVVTLSKIYCDSDGLKGIYKSMKGTWNEDDPDLQRAYRSNLIQLVFDTLSWIFLGTIVAGLLTGWDKDLTKLAKKDKDMGEAAVATGAHILLQSVARSTEDFNYINTVTAPFADWQPMSLAWGKNLLANASQTAFGDRTFLQGLSHFSSGVGNFSPLIETYTNINK